MASQLIQEITDLKSSTLLSKLKVIENVGEYKYIITAILKGFDVTLKFQLLGELNTNLKRIKTCIVF